MSTPVAIFGPVTADLTPETVHTGLANTVLTIESLTMAQPSTGVATTIRLTMGTDGATTRVIEYPIPAGVGTYTIYPMIKVSGAVAIQLSSTVSDDVVVCTASGRRDAL